MSERTHTLRSWEGRFRPRESQNRVPWETRSLVCRGRPGEQAKGRCSRRRRGRASGGPSARAGGWDFILRTAGGL